MFLPLCLLTPACVDHQPDAQSRQDALMKDPFSYKTDDTPDISGGKTNQLDRDALKKDLDHVLNP